MIDQNFARRVAPVVDPNAIRPPSDRRFAGLTPRPGTPEYDEMIRKASKDATKPPRTVEEYLAERTVDNPPPGLVLPENQPPHSSAPTAVGAQAVPPTRRIGIYCGRGEEFRVLVEEAPDWDSVEGLGFVFTPDVLKAVLPLLRGMGLKISDKTGGELVALQVG